MSGRGKPSGMTGAQIKAFRVARRMSQIDLAKKLGINQNSMSFLENDKVSIDIRTKLAIYAIAAELDHYPPPLT
jgi:transcriptional regulator with XRE-family HTH domain